MKKMSMMVLALAVLPVSGFADGVGNAKTFADFVHTYISSWDSNLPASQAGAMTYSDLRAPDNLDKIEWDGFHGSQKEKIEWLRSKLRFENGILGKELGMPTSISYHPAKTKRYRQLKNYPLFGTVETSHSYDIDFSQEPGAKVTDSNASCIKNQMNEIKQALPELKRRGAKQVYLRLFDRSTASPSALKEDLTDEALAERENVELISGRDIKDLFTDAWPNGSGAKKRISDVFYYRLFDDKLFLNRDTVSDAGVDIELSGLRVPTAIVEFSISAKKECQVRSKDEILNVYDKINYDPNKVDPQTLDMNQRLRDSLGGATSRNESGARIFDTVSKNNSESDMGSDGAYSDMSSASAAE